MEDKNEKDELVFLADWLKKAINLVLKFFLNVFKFSVKKFIYILFYLYFKIEYYVIIKI